MTKTKSMMQRRLKKDIPYSEIKKIVYNIIADYYKIGINEFIFSPPCCKQIVIFDINALPLEDITCNCGKTKLIEYIYY